MNLIGSFKIAKYIRDNPKTRVSLLIFLREFTYHNDQYLDTERSAESVFMIDGIDCMVRVKINRHIKTANIIHISDREVVEPQEPATVKISKKITQVLLVPPPPPSLEEIEEKLKRRKIESEVRYSSLLLNDKIASATGVLATEEYLESMKRIDAIFGAEPGMPQYDQLEKLVPQIINYEGHVPEFPRLTIAEMVQHRMDLFKSTPRQLSQIAGSENELNLFLSGKLVLTDDVLTRLFQMLALRAPVIDRRFLE